MKGRGKIPRIFVLLLAGTCLVVPAIVIANTDVRNREMANSKRKVKGVEKNEYWVHRRAAGDKDKSGALAVVVRLEVNGIGEAKAWIWRYTSLNGSGYVGRKPLIRATGKVNGDATGNAINRETLTLIDEAGDPVAYITLYKGNKKIPAGIQQRRDQQRFVFRWGDKYQTAVSSTSTVTDVGAGAGAGCPEPPDDDPMEEEAPITEAFPMPGENDPPEMPAEPLLADP